MAKELVTAETNLNGKKTRKTSVPANADRITEGALNLELNLRVELRNKLSDSIEKELTDLEEKVKVARNLFNRL